MYPYYAVRLSEGNLGLGAGWDLYLYSTGAMYCTPRWLTGLLKIKSQLHIVLTQNKGINNSVHLFCF